MKTSRVCRMALGMWLSLLLLGCRTKEEHGRDAAGDGGADVGETDAIDSGDAADHASGEPDVADAGSGVTLGEIGIACKVNAECASGSCVDGVCCSSSMCGACQSCAVPDDPGVCAPLPPFAEDPASDCAAPNACDGAGHCLAVNGQRCATDAECVSNFCTDGVCCGSRCDGQCFSCALAGSEGTCEPLNDVQDFFASTLCAGLYLCVATASGAPACLARDGVTCASDLDCASGHCRTYYLDGDGDGYGASLHTLVRCDANVNPPSGYVAIGGDCCDFDKTANPAVPKTSYFTTPDACGDFDYDCDGLLEKQHTTGSCVGLSSGVTPDCGKACESGFGIHLTSLYTQACR
jgi:hypothetical protein